MGHSDMVSLWYASLLTNTRFYFLFFRMNNCLLYLMLHKETRASKRLREAIKL